MTRVLTSRDRAFLAQHRKLAREDDRPARGSAELVAIAGEILAKHPGGKAVKFFDGIRTQWVPASQLTDNGDGTFAMPEWLAKEKGFI